MIARVLPLTRTRAVRGPFDYRLTDEQAGVDVGSLLRVPFGAQRTLGVVVELAERSELAPDRLAAPDAVVGAGLTPELVSLLVGVVATGLASIIGVAVGTLAGYLGGIVDTVLMRITDVVLSFPILLFCIALIAVTGPSTQNVVLVIAFGYWTYLARIVRSLVLSLKEREFVTAAKTLGTGDLTILRRHILPHLAPAIIVYATLGVASSIMIEASLSYLGIGVPLPQASWGQMISQGQQYFQSAPWLLIAPGVCLIVTVLAFNLAGDWMTDLLDPSDEGRR